MKKRADHVAILMDGCTVWSSRRNLSPTSGLWASALAAASTIESAAQSGIRHLTLVPTDSFPLTGNSEAGLVISQLLRSHADTFRHLSLRFSARGELTQLPADLQQRLSAMETATAHELGMNLTLLLNYSGRRDILRVARDLASEVKAGRLSAESISPALIQKRLVTAALPGVDLIVYTGQSHRLADALTFESAYAEFAFTDCLWPDFTPSDLQGALADFGHRERRYGKTSAQVQSPTPS